MIYLSILVNSLISNDKNARLWIIFVITLIQNNLPEFDREYAYYTQTFLMLTIVPK